MDNLSPRSHPKISRKLRDLLSGLFGLAVLVMVIFVPLGLAAQVEGVLDGTDFNIWNQNKFGISL